MTLVRRTIWNRVNSELHSYSQEWVKNGKVFVKRHANGRSIRVISEKLLNDLIAKQAAPLMKDSQPSNPVESTRRRRWPRRGLVNMSVTRSDSYVPPNTVPPQRPNRGGRMRNLTLADYYIPEPIQSAPLFSSVVKRSLLN